MKELLSAIEEDSPSLCQLPQHSLNFCCSVLGWLGRADRIMSDDDFNSGDDGEKILSRAADDGSDDGWGCAVVGFRLWILFRSSCCRQQYLNKPWRNDSCGPEVLFPSKDTSRTAPSELERWQTRTPIEENPFQVTNANGC